MEMEEERRFNGIQESINGFGGVYGFVEEGDGAGDEDERRKNKV